MNQELQQPFIAAAYQCFQTLSECPELKNYRIYRDSGVLPCKPMKDCASLVEEDRPTRTTAKHCARKWILVVSAKRSDETGLFVVKVRGCRYGSIPL